MVGSKLLWKKSERRTWHLLCFSDERDDDIDDVYDDDHNDDDDCDNDIEADNNSLCHLQLPLNKFWFFFSIHFSFQTLNNQKCEGKKKMKWMGKKEKETEKGRKN